MRKWANVKWAVEHSVTILPPVLTLYPMPGKATGHLIIINALKNENAKNARKALNEEKQQEWVCAANRQAYILSVLHTASWLEKQQRAMHMPRPTQVHLNGKVEEQLKQNVKNVNTPARYPKWDQTKQ